MISAVTVLGVAAGCGGTGDTGGSGGPAGAEATAAAPVTTPADPKEAFLASYKALEAGHYAYSVNVSGTESTGIVYAPTKSASTHNVGEVDGNAFTTDTIFADGKTFVRMDLGSEGNERLGIKAGTWYEVDTAVAKKLDYTFEELSPVQPNFHSSVVTAERDGDKAFRGTFDFSVAAEGNPNPQTETLVQNLGDAAKSIAFTAKLDDRNRISELVWTFEKTEKTPAYVQKISFSEYGTANAPSAPAAEKAPAALNEIYA